MIINCKTSRAIVLVPMDGGNGLWVFPSDEGPWSGLHLDVAPLMPVIPQIAGMIHARLGFDMSEAGYSLCEEFADIVPIDNDTEVTVFAVKAGKLQPASRIPANPSRPLRLGTMPEWLGRLPQSRQRLAWLRAWQVYQGVLTQTVKAVDAAEVLKEVAQPGPQP